MSGFSRTSSAWRPASAGPAIDHALVTYFPAPASYTGDDVVEISAHGSPVVLTAIVNAAVDRGARLAEPGEFTLRAFVNGRIDLPQAEAVADLIDAATPLQARAAFDQLNGTLTETVGAIDRALFDLIARLEASVDFPEDGYHFVDPSELAVAIDAIRERTTALLCSARRGRLIRDGLTVAIIGKPNVGKSSVFNALVGARRAIVTDVPGTTRDLVSETVDIEGLRVTLVDTAGLRETADVVESEGVSRSVGAASVADLVLMVCDLSDRSTLDAETSAQSANARTLLVANKADLARAWSRKDAVEICATTGSGIDQLRRRIVRRARRGSPGRSSGKSRTCVISRSSSRPTARCSARASRRSQKVRRCRKNSCSRICRRRARHSKKSRDAERRTICWRTSSRDSVSANDVRRDCDRRGPCGLRSRVCGGASWRSRRAVHADRRHGCPHALQSRRGRYCKGSSRPGNRRARRLDGPRDRCDRDSIQTAQSEPRPRGLVASRAGGQEALWPVGAPGAGIRAEYRMALRPCGPDRD